MNDVNLVLHIALTSLHFVT